MRRVIYTSLGLLIWVSCNVSNTAEEFEFEWNEVAQFQRNQITAIHVSDSDELYVATGKRLFRSVSRNEAYIRLNSPDSASVIKIRTFEDRIIILTNVFQRDIGNFGEDVNFLYQSVDDGFTWQEIASGFTMQDVAYQDNKIHIARTKGITTIDLNSGVTSANQIVDSKLSDVMDEIEVSPDGKIVVACHEGVFISEDNGANWTEIATQIGKDNDWIRSIEFRGNDLYALESSRVYRIDLTTDEVETHKGFVGYEELEITSTGQIIKLGSSKLGIANLDNLNFANIFPTNVSEERLSLDFVDSFADGTLAITAGEKLYLVERIN